MNIHDHARNLVGQSVVAHHKDGRVYHGVLHSVTRRGIYIRPHDVHVAADGHPVEINLADGGEPINGELVYGGLWFLPWFALGALTATALWW